MHSWGIELITGGLLGVDDGLSEYCRRLICLDELLLPDSTAAGPATMVVGDKARFGDWKRAGLSNGVALAETSLGAVVGSMFIRLDSSSWAVTFGWWLGSHGSRFPVCDSTLVG